MLCFPRDGDLPKGHAADSPTQLSSLVIDQLIFVFELESAELLPSVFDIVSGCLVFCGFFLRVVSCCLLTLRSRFFRVLFVLER